MLKNPIEYLKHIRDECEYLLKNSTDMNYDDFIDNDTLKRSFVRSLEIIGEATKQLPQELTQQHTSIDWKGMARMRDILIHDYFGINYKIVWDVVINHIPKLMDEVKVIIKQKY